MFDSALTILIIAFSIGLSGYWFRYVCLLILSTKTTRDFAADVALANQLSFLEVQTQLRGEGQPDFDRLQASLDRDYALITSLIHASQGELRLEDRLLQVNYRIMGVFCQVSNRFSATMGRRALDEMSSVIAHFANAMGERAMAGAAA